MKNMGKRHLLGGALAVLLATGARGADADAALSAVASYTYGQSRAGLLALEQVVQASAGDSQAREALSANMAAMLSSGASTDCKRFLCRQLSLIGTHENVPALVALLSDKELGMAARSALERIPGDEVDQALRAALVKSNGMTALGLVDTLGRRKDAASVDAIAAFARDADRTVAAGAVAALGTIGGKEAMAVLMNADRDVGGEVRLALNDALLQCADASAGEGERALAAAAYRKLSEAGRPAHVRLAAFPGLVASQAEVGVSLVLGALTGDDPAMRRAAIRSLRTIPGDETTLAVVKALDGLDAEARIQVVNALVDRGDPAAIGGITQLLDGGSLEVKQVAVAALGSLGNASTVRVLAGLLGDADLGVIAFRGLTRIKGDGVDEAMVAVLGDGTARQKADMATVLRERGARGAVSALMKAATDPNAKVSREALRSLGVLATPADSEDLIALLGRADSAGEMRGIANALVVLSGRESSVQQPIAQAAAAASGASRVALISILGKTGGREALAVLRQTLQARDTDVRTAAVKAVSEWDDAEPLPDLLALLRIEKEVGPKALACRGFVDLSAGDKGRSPAELATMYAEVMALAGRPEDRRVVVGGLGNVPSPETLRLAVSCLGSDTTVNEAGLAVVQIAPHLMSSHAKDVGDAVKAVLASCDLEAVTAKAKDLLFQLSKPVNLARGAKISSPDGLEKDGAAGGDQAAIDGDPDTYWDEANGQALYILRLDFTLATTVTDLSILGYQHHSYAPRDFEIVCDGKTVKTVRDAAYTDNTLCVTMPRTTCKSLELRITKSYGASPAIRELELYNVE